MYKPTHIFISVKKRTNLNEMYNSTLYVTIIIIITIIFLYLLFITTYTKYRNIEFKLRIENVKYKFKYQYLKNMIGIQFKYFKYRLRKTPQTIEYF